MSARFGSTAEAGRLLYMSPDSVLRRIKRGDIAAVQCGRLWRVRLDLLGALR